MRIIAGEFRSRTLLAPKGTATRPTMDRAREALFNVLSGLIDFAGISVLDLFAGSGALAFEALSRGAAQAMLVDRDRKAIKAIQVNMRVLQVEKKVTLSQHEVRKFLNHTKGKQFDLIFADPPYEEKQIETLVEAIFEGEWLAPRGHCIIEHRFDTALEPIKNTKIARELKSGEAHFTMLTHATP